MEEFVQSTRRWYRQGEPERCRRIVRLPNNQHLREGVAETQPLLYAKVEKTMPTITYDSTVQKCIVLFLCRSSTTVSAPVYANTGAGTIEKAVDMATKDFLMRGIDCIEYKNGARHSIEDYADMCIKTAERRAYLAGEGKTRKEWGESLVIVNKRGDDPCPHCAKWVGKILIDDVYSGGEPDGKRR